LPNKNPELYPDCPVVARTVEAGGMIKPELLHQLQQASISLNEYGYRLFSDDLFITSPTKYTVETVELSVAALGFPEGAPLDRIFQRAKELGLELCPLELAPHFRLQYLDQPEGYSGNSSQHQQAPSGSITIASAVLMEDHEYPKGFYLRKINGFLWLRGYIADYLHIWNPHDHFIFIKSSGGEVK
jgi:hypothetical protein